MPASGAAYSVHYGPQGQRASTRPQAWRIADGEAAETSSPSPRSVQGSPGSSAGSRPRSPPQRGPQARRPAASGPVPVGVDDLEQHQTWQERAPLRRAPTVRNR